MRITHISGKRIEVKAPAYALFNLFSNMQNFIANLPPEKREEIRATEDTIEGTVKGFNVGMKILERNPFSSITYEQFGAMPFNFTLTVKLDAIEVALTEFHIELDAELNFLMKTMFGGKLQQIVDQVTDALSAAFRGEMPAGVDINQFK